MEEKSALRARNAKRHAQGITAIHSPLKSMILYWISGMTLDGSESLETSKSMIKMKWKSIGLTESHGSIETSNLSIMEKSQMFCHPIGHLTMPLTFNRVQNPLGDPLTLSQKRVISTQGIH
jgi:hypothetical protein